MTAKFAHNRACRYRQALPRQHLGRIHPDGLAAHILDHYLGVWIIRRDDEELRIRHASGKWHGGGLQNIVNWDKQYWDAVAGANDPFVRTALTPG